MTQHNPLPNPDPPTQPDSRVGAAVERTRCVPLCGEADTQGWDCVAGHQGVKVCKGKGVDVQGWGVWGKGLQLLR